MLGRNVMFMNVRKSKKNCFLVTTAIRPTHQTLTLAIRQSYFKVLGSSSYGQRQNMAVINCSCKYVSVDTAMHTFVTTTHSVPVESNTAQRIWLYYSDKYMPLCYDKLAVNLEIAVKQKTGVILTVIPYILESNPHRFYSFIGLKNHMRISIACGLDSRS